MDERWLKELLAPLQMALDYPDKSGEAVIAFNKMFDRVPHPKVSKADERKFAIFNELSMDFAYYQGDPRIRHEPLFGNDELKVKIEAALRKLSLLGP